MLALACGAMLCGARRDRAIAAWGGHDGAPIARALGVRHPPPCAATRPRMFRRLDGARFEAQLGAWAEPRVARMAPGIGRRPGSEPAVALEGHTRRGARTPGAPGGHLRSAVAHQGGVTLAPQAVAEKTNERTAVETGRSQLVRTGRVVTREARLTQTAVAHTIVAAGGDDVMVVNANPPHRRAEMALIGAEPPVGDSQEPADTIETGHGRLEPRRFTTRQALTGSRAWPGLAQGFASERSVSIPNPGDVRAETVSGGTSLASPQATPARRLELVRGPWQIENPSPGGVR